MTAQQKARAYVLDRRGIKRAEICRQLHCTPTELAEALGHIHPERSADGMEVRSICNYCKIRPKHRTLEEHAQIVIANFGDIVDAATLRRWCGL